MAAAIIFEPDAFILKGRQVMGRRTAGASFLRAAVEGRGPEPVTAYITTETARASFLKAVGDLDPGADTHCIAAGSLDQISECGTLYRPDPMIAADARLRLRRGAAGYSICGITHTISTARILEGLGRLVSEPVMEWDAIICTSSVAQQVVRSSMDSAWEQLRWLTGTGERRPAPQLPVIPLGVHCRDWESSEGQRAGARARLGLDHGDMALLFAGRLSYGGKAHPFPMFRALQMVSEGAGQKLTLIMAGQYFLEHVRQAFEEAARVLCPDVRIIHVDGIAAEDYRLAFSAADIFISLADSHQETFGITPVEAMASGLPVIVSDWNGYRDTVRDGIDGFRIPTWAPAPETGRELSRFYESTGAFETYSMRASAPVSVDMPALVAGLTHLVKDPHLRKSFGEAGRRRSVQTFDWQVIYPRYLELWRELADIREGAQKDPAMRAFLKASPSSHHSWPDPFDRFASFSSHHIDAATTVYRPPATDLEYADLSGLAIFASISFSPALANAILDAADRGPVSIRDIAGHLGFNIALTTELVGRLAKMNLVRLGTPDSRRMGFSAVDRS